MRLFTIGFTKKTAERFFTLLRDAGVRRVVDVRLNNASQLAGFAKRDDLRYFLRAVADIDYVHLPEFTPDQEMLTAYKKEKGEWSDYEVRFLALMAQRAIESSAAQQLRDGDCLLCSEHEPDRCHRRLVVDYLIERGLKVDLRHLM